ncbi:SpvB/TcaC N-terminal domain-containing protein (plasmid) [Enterobacter sp. JS8-1]|uniref:SpvB/TcaC N-terminal domain-containing protein n=1 Tax=Enterobacter sp. JS8-1 TaxID=3411633 RepID=UPI003BA25CBA
MQESASLQIQPPALPKGGGTLSGMGESLSAAGPDGTASFTVPLPVSPGRGYAPELALSYSSTAGSSEFGMGWGCQLPSFSLRTAKGVPQYAGEDEIVGPDGEVLVPVVDGQGKPLQRTGTMGSTSCTVTRWQSRVVSSMPPRMEYWQPSASSGEQPFWVMLTPDGQRHLFGRTASARVADPQNVSHIAVWLQEESVSPTGEHIHYAWRAEDDAGCDKDELALHHGAHAGRYLTQVNYGNVKPSRTFMLENGGAPAENSWLFHLVFDYGERSSSLNDVPAYATAGTWPCRPDSSSRYGYGFEVRTRRLCRQVLMFHRLAALAGKSVQSEVPALVSRLILTHDMNTSASLLLSVRQVAHEADGTPVTLAPLEFDYQRFVPEMNTTWQAAPQLNKLNAYQPWQMADLYGEGIPGLLYQDMPGAWWYQAPVRDTSGSDTDAVAYTAPVPLPRIPVQQDSAVLMDINGDGALEWMVSGAGVQGYHAMLPTQDWTSFVPLSAVPLEYFHPQAQFSDITGAGLPDLTLIGPRSVRFWASEREFWSKASDVAHAASLPLPVPGRDDRRLVAFSDMTGSGQSHLTEISADTVRYWPNLGHGVFGEPVTMTGFHVDGETFNPERLHIADLDGSGTSDLIYARHDHLEVYLNESGNRFATPISIALPEGVFFDDTCRLQVADIQGLGVSSILLTLPHMPVQHWRLDLVTRKPLLLNAINNNMGADTTLEYRSSAQFWLDEKQQLTDAGRQAFSYLPFPVHLQWRTQVLDEISGNRLSSQCVYRHGAWDGREREYRGFACVEQTDTDALAMASRGAQTDNPAPARTVSWFTTGVDAVDSQLADEFWRGDKQAFPGFTARFTRFDTTTGHDVILAPDDEQTYWLSRALKGSLLRSELYGDDGSDRAGIPYTVSESRSQARLLNGMDGRDPAVMVSVTESRSWQYERVAADPQCSQQIVLKQDENGLPTDSVEIAYPRRDKPAKSLYPDTLPETLFDSSYDDQQRMLRISRTRSTTYTLSDNDTWLPGLADTTRTDICELTAERVPTGGISLEWCLGAGASMLPGVTAQDYAGHSRVVYTGDDGKPVFPPLVAWTEVTDLDEHALSAFDGILSAGALTSLLKESGRLTVSVPFDTSNVTVYVSRQGLTIYAGAVEFYCPLKQRQTELTGVTTLDWDTHHCAVVTTTDAAGLQVSAEYDYRFLAPSKTRDANDNVTLAHYDALGRLISTRFSGTENGLKRGYTLPEEEKEPFRVPVTIDDALNLKPGIPVAGFQIYDTLSWMSTAKDSGKMHAADVDYVTEDGYITRLAWRRRHERAGDTPRGEPPHIMSVTTDRYDSEPEQQLSQSVSFSDGFGRLLQAATRHEAGEAWQRTKEGGLVVGNDGPVNAETDFRWAVSGRTEYDSKGQPVRAYQPYFLDNWKYVSDDSARQDLFADTHHYDPTGREISVTTAKGWQRLVFYTPWFAVSEDENDTLAD